MASLTTTVLVTEIREAPDIPQANDFPGHGQHIFQLVVPVVPFQRLIGCLFLLLFPRGLCRYFAVDHCPWDSVIHSTFKIRKERDKSVPLSSPHPLPFQRYAYNNTRSKIHAGRGGRHKKQEHAQKFTPQVPAYHSGRC